MELQQKTHCRGGSFCKKRARMWPSKKHKHPSSPNPQPGSSRTHGAEFGEAETKRSPKASVNLFNPRQLSFAQPSSCAMRQTTCGSQKFKSR